MWCDLEVLNSSTTISHLFFADDLMLFCKATESDCRTVMDTLNTFYGASGVNINFFKSKFYASQNVSKRDFNAFTAISGMNVTKHLGIYLDAPIIHGRIKRSHFNFVVTPEKPIRA